MKEILKKLNEKRSLAIVGGGKTRQDSQHKKENSLHEKELRCY